jgi:hypothetical protein
MTAPAGGLDWGEAERRQRRLELLVAPGLVEARRLTFGNIDLGSWREVTRRGRVLTKGVRLLAVAR